MLALSCSCKSRGRALLDAPDAAQLLGWGVRGAHGDVVGGMQASCEGGGGGENMQFRASHISKSLKWAIKQNSPA